MLILLQIVAINTISSSIGVLKTIFTAKKLKNPLYLVSFVDAFLFAYVLKFIGGGTGITFALAYAIGRVLGSMLGNYLEGKLALGTIEVSIYVSNKEKMIEIADSLREYGYSVNTVIAGGYHGQKRYEITVMAQRKEKGQIIDVVKYFGIESPTFIEREISGFGGKITI